MLVYENYSKFITATDTIRRMKDNVDEMGGRMGELQATIAATAHASEHVNAKLGQHRDEIEQLNSVRGLLKKLQCVFDLPARLRSCLELNSLGSAVREYAAAAPLLERHGTGAFASVAREVSSTVKAIGERLRATLRDPATRPDDAAEALELLQMLRLPQDELQREWVSERRKALNGAIAAAAAAWPAPELGRPGVNAATNWLSHLNAAYLAELMQTVKSYSELFAESRTALVELGRATFVDYFNLVKATLAPAPAEHARHAEVSGRHLMTALARLAVDLSGVSRLLPELRLNDRSAEVVELAVRRHVTRVFARIEARTAQGLKAALADLEATQDSASAESCPSLLRLQAQLSGEVTEAVAAGLRDVATLQEEHSGLLASWKEVFVDLVHAQSQLLFTGLVATFIAAAALPPMPEVASLNALQQAAPDAPVAPPAAPDALPPAVFILFLLRLCGSLEETAMPAVAARLSSGFTDGVAPQFSAPAVQRLLRTAASRLLVGYVQQQGRKLSKQVRRSMATPDWLSLPEPRDVRPVCESIVSELVLVDDQVAQMLPRQERGAPERAAEASDRTGIQRNVAKLFQEKLRIFDEVDMTRSSVLLGVIKIALKSWVECVRLVTVGRNGYNQLQLDVHYLRPTLRAHAAGSPEVVDSLLDEILGGAADRCAAPPVSLDASALDLILVSRGGR